MIYVESGTLTIHDSGENGKLECVNPAHVIYTVNGSVTLESGILSNGNSYEAAVNDTGSFTMTGGTVNGYIFINGTAFISGGTVNGYLNLWTGTLSVSGGPALGETCYIAYDGTYLPTVDLRGMNDCTAMKLMVYSCPDGLYNYITLPAGYALYSGDTIVGESDFVNDDSTLTIGQCPHSSFDANGKCTICGYRYAASVTTSGGEVTKYATLAEAISAASSGDKITLLDDVTIGQNETAAFDAWVEIEANGHTITNNGTIVLPSTYTWATIPSGITGGTVTIGSKSYTWNGIKYVCANDAHSGGTATCKHGKVCEICGTEYGEVDKNNHESEETYYKAREDGVYHDKLRKCCDAVEGTWTHWDGDDDNKCDNCATALAAKAYLKACASPNIEEGWYYYTTLEGALAWVNTYGTQLRLVNNAVIAEGKTITVANSVTLDTNGYTLTNNGTLVLSAAKYTGTTIPSGITGGTVTIGSKSYTWNGTKYVCADENSHIWADATCTTPKTCFVCGKTDGNVGEHTLGEDGICTVCQSAFSVTLTETGSKFGGYVLTKSVADRGEELTVTVTTASSVNSTGVYVNINSVSVGGTVLIKGVDYKTEGTQIRVYAGKVTGPVVVDISAYAMITLVLNGGEPTAETQAKLDAAGIAVINGCVTVPKLYGVVGDSLAALGSQFVKDGCLLTGATYRAGGNVDFTAGSQTCTIILQWTEITLSESSVAYTGREVTPTVTVGTLTEGTDFSVSYSDNVNVGTATVTVTGKGAYGGTASISFAIDKAPPTVTAPTANKLTYTGKAQALVTAGSSADGTMMYKLGEDGTYSTNIPTAKDAGSYTVYYYVKGDSNHNDSEAQKISVTMEQLDITGKTVDITLAGSLTYNGAEQTMGVSSVRVDGLNVTYTVSGNTGTDAMTYTLTVTANGNFKGTAAKAWSIVKESASPATGDDSHIGPWALIMCASTLGLAAMLVDSKRRRSAK